MRGRAWKRDGDLWGRDGSCKGRDEIAQWDVTRRASVTRRGKRRGGAGNARVVLVMPAPAPGCTENQAGFEVSHRRHLRSAQATLTKRTGDVRSGQAQQGRALARNTAPGRVGMGRGASMESRRRSWGGCAPQDRGLSMCGDRAASLACPLHCDGAGTPPPPLPAFPSTAAHTGRRGRHGGEPAVRLTGGKLDIDIDFVLPILIHGRQVRGQRGRLGR